MTDRVHPLVQAMKAPGAHPVIDRVLPQSHLDQLRAFDDPMLPSCNLGDVLVHRTSLR
jgi:hypothetical protein